MIYKCTNGFVVFTFQSIQEFEMLMDILPIPDLVPMNNVPLTFIPASQALNRYIVKGVPVSTTAIPTSSNEDIVMGFKDNRFSYSFAADTIVMRDSIINKVELSKNRLGKYYGNFLLQPYSLVGFNGRATDFEAVYMPDRGVFVYTYIRFEYE